MAADREPTLFTPPDHLVGLDAPTRVLWRALEHDRVAGAYLLKGPTGAGKTTLALAFARAATCAAPASSPFGACGQCESCRRAAAGSHPEIVLIRPAGDQTQIWQLWDRSGKPPGALEHSLPFAPGIGRRKVFIIERTDTLSPGAANSLLKVLEEPPAYAVFLLLTPTTERLLPTIVSRCQAVAVRPTDTRVIENWLIDRHGIPAEAAALVASVADGLPGAALSLARSSSAAESVEACTDVALQLATARPLTALRIAEELRAASRNLAPRSENEDPDAGGKLRVDRGALGSALDLTAVVFRDLLLLGLDPESRQIVNSHRRHVLAGAAREYPIQRWIAALDAVATARRRIEQNVPPNLVTDWLAMSITTEAGQLA